MSAKNRFAHESLMLEHSPSITKTMRQSRSVGEIEKCVIAAVMGWANSPGEFHRSHSGLFFVSFSGNFLLDKMFRMP